MSALTTERPGSQAEPVDASSRSGRLRGAAQRARQRARAAPVLTTVEICCGLALIAQLVGLMLWSWHLLSQASLSWDFGIYYQPWSLIAHGHLLPKNSFQGGYLFWRNDGELLVYLLAPLYWLFPNSMLGYLWLQDLAIVGTGALVLATVRDVARRRDVGERRTNAITATALAVTTVLLVANPWVYWTASFDIHMEVFGTFFAVGMLRALLRRRRSAWLWAALTLACGAACALFVVGIGLGVAVLALARWWWERRRGEGEARPHALRRALATPVILVAAALGWLVLLGKVNALQGSPSAAYRYLLGPHAGSGKPSMERIAFAAAQHPATVLRVLGTHGWNLWANTSPDGFVGLLHPLGLLAVAPTLLANNLHPSQSFSYPSFQNFFVYALVAITSAWVLVALLSRRLWPVGVALALAMVLNAGGWFNVWFSTTSGQWVHVDPTAASMIRQVSHEAMAEDEVVASQGYVGLFGGRQYVYSFSRALVLPLHARRVWFVLSPVQGIQTASQAQTYEAVNAILQLPGVETRVANVDGMWIFRWSPPRGMRSLALGELGAHYPVWIAPGDAATSVTSGSPASWHVHATGKSGYLFATDYVQLNPGRYVAKVHFRSDVPLRIEVQNDVTGEVIASSERIARRAGTARLAFTLAPAPPPGTLPYSGRGIFRETPIPPGPNPVADIRVSTPGGRSTDIWWTSIEPAS